MSGLDVDVMRARYDQLGRELDQLERERDAAIYERDAALAVVERVRAIHRNDDSGAAAPPVPGMCEVCLYEWPCPTIRALDGER